jgi:hypothetical protein
MATSAMSIGRYGELATEIADFLNNVGALSEQVQQCEDGFSLDDVKASGKGLRAWVAVHASSLENLNAQYQSLLQRLTGKTDEIERIVCQVFLTQLQPTQARRQRTEEILHLCDWDLISGKAGLEVELNLQRLAARVDNLIQRKRVGAAEGLTQEELIEVCDELHHVGTCEARLLRESEERRLVFSDSLERLRVENKRMFVDLVERLETNFNQSQVRRHVFREGARLETGSPDVRPAVAVAWSHPEVTEVHLFCAQAVDLKRLLEKGGARREELIVELQRIQGLLAESIARLPIELREEIYRQVCLVSGQAEGSNWGEQHVAEDLGIVERAIAAALDAYPQYVPHVDKSLSFEEVSLDSMSPPWGPVEVLIQDGRRVCAEPSFIDQLEGLGNALSEILQKETAEPAKREEMRKEFLSFQAEMERIDPDRAVQALDHIYAYIQQFSEEGKHEGPEWRRDHAFDRLDLLLAAVQNEFLHGVIGA